MTRLIGLLLAVPLCLVASTRHVSSAPTAGGTTTAHPSAVIPHPVEQELRPGDRLIESLRDTRQPHAKRAAAAEELGRMKYRPAIPVLLDHIDMRLVDSKKASEIEWYEDPFDDLVGPPGPCMKALQQFGTEVIPPAVRQYLSPRATWQREHLWYFLALLARRERYRVQDSIRTVLRKVTDPQEKKLVAELYARLGGDMSEFDATRWPKH
jgi:hypothetical protein